tara:strand:+ start:1717 stop:1992 length:276 start_codon:yes stop_codon:yes gene_type:complete
MIINGIKCKTQLEAVLQYMQGGTPLSQEVAYDKIGTQRLGDVIFRLRGLGYNIQNINCKGSNRFGNSVSFVKYFLANTREEIEALAVRHNG